jgi:hypothetical protein
MTKATLSLGAVSTLVLVTVSARAADPPPGGATDHSATPTAGSGPVVNGQSLTATTQASGPAERFGRQHQIAISSDNSLTVSSATISGVDGSTTTVVLEPAIDYFLVDGLSIGGFTEFMYVSNNGGHASTFGMGPRVGYNWTLSDLISFWPKVGLSIQNTSLTGNPTVTSTGAAVSSTTVSTTNLAIDLYVPLMFHPAPHFFAGIGPFLDADLTGSPTTTTWGGKITLGGWVL